MNRAVALALVLSACSPPPTRAPDHSAGARLEQAAAAAGLVASANASVAGSWGQGSDRMCIMGTGERDTRVGALVDYGEGQSCALSGTLRRHGDRLDLAFGACRITAGIDGDRIIFPPEVPAACDTMCGGRASLAALSVDRVSESLAEAATLKSPRGRLLCVG